MAYGKSLLTLERDEEKFQVNYLRNRALNLGEKDLGRSRGTLSILYLGGKVISGRKLREFPFNCSICFQ